MLVEDGKITFRVVTIGDSSVGKTCILNRFLHDKFDVNQTNTVGAQLNNYKEVRNGQEIVVQLWDTAGQERYSSLGPIYFRNAAGALLVFDITNSKSFSTLEKWLESFRSVTSDHTLIILVGNKIDLESGREVPYDLASKWAQEHECLYCETSAATGTGIKELFDQLGSVLLERNVVAHEERTQTFIKPEREAPEESKCNC